MITNTSQLISNYISTRDHFNAVGGREFLTDRTALRTAYLASSVAKDTLSQWTQSLPKPAEQEFSHRFREWDKKVESGLKARDAKPSVSETDFMQRVKAFYEKHRPLILGNELDQLNQARNALKAVIIPQLKSKPPGQIILELSITDEELRNRIQHEWVWKARQ